jgi:transposase-like protein
MPTETTPSKLQKKHSTPEERQAMIESWHRSGLTQKAFCAQQGINDKTFASWLKAYRLNHKSEKLTSCSTKFATIAPIANPTPIAPIIIRLPSGAQIPFIKQLIDLLER